MNRRTEFQVGLTVLVALAILVGSVAWLKDYSVQHSARIWNVEFPETGGLAARDEVLVNGLRKGEVRSMRLVGDRVLVELSLAKEITLTRDSQVAIRNVGLMGERVIAVDLKTSGAPYSERDIIHGSYEKGLSEVMGQLGGTVEAISRMAERLEDVADMLAANGKLSSTIQNFSRTSEDLRLAVSENRATLREALSNFASASRTAKSLTTDREAQLRQTLDHFSSAAAKMEQLSVRLDSLRLVIQRVSGKLDRGEGTIGKLVQDDRLYGELNDSVQSLKALIQDIKAHPKRYFKISVF